MATCIYCQASFDPPNPTTTFCRNCWYSGRALEAERDTLLDNLRSIQGVDRADIAHTGGGCFGLAILLLDGRYLFATDAQQDETTKEWYAEASLPDPGQPWGMSVNVSEDTFCNGDETEPMRVPLTDAELIAAVREITGRTV